MMKIMIVDDNPQNQYLLQVLLTANGYEVALASNGEEALKVAQAQPPDIIVSDILMPVMDGFALCRAWKTDERLKEIPFVFYTVTYTDPRDEEFALSLGAERFIIKPQEPSAFLKILHEVLETYKTGNLTPANQPVEDVSFLRMYNASLVRKLEDKVLQLEEAKRALEADILKRTRAENEVRQMNETLEARVEERTRELREAHEQMLRQERLATLGRLAGGVSHELRNPLGVISNAVYFLKVIQPSADEKVLEYLDLIERENQAATQLVIDLLNYSNIPPGDRQNVRVLDTVNQVLARRPAPEGITINLDFPEDLPEAYIDPSQLMQVLENLVVNAYQAMPAGGRLTLRGEAVAVGAESASPETGLCLSVQDTGIGILPENMPRIFEPLFSTKPRGIGLGLALSQRLIEANGGRIEVQSEPGEGAIFSLFLAVKP